jgi:saccharopine dehydrogenase-like NADP-dependent oxidoreductase
VQKIFVAGSGGMVGSAVCRQLKMMGDCEVIVASRANLDLLDLLQRLGVSLLTIIILPILYMKI